MCKHLFHFNDSLKVVHKPERKSSNGKSEVNIILLQKK